MPTQLVSDLGFAAALMTLGYPVGQDLIDGDDGRKFFEFKIENRMIGSHLMNYKTRNLDIDALTYAEAIRLAKRMLYGDKKTTCKVELVGVT